MVNETAARHRLRFRQEAFRRTFGSLWTIAASVVATLLWLAWVAVGQGTEAAWTAVEKALFSAAVFLAFAACAYTRNRIRVVEEELFAEHQRVQLFETAKDAEILDLRNRMEAASAAQSPASPPLHILPERCSFSNGKAILWIINGDQTDRFRAKIIRCAGSEVLAGATPWVVPWEGAAGEWRNIIPNQTAHLAICQYEWPWGRSLGHSFPRKVSFKRFAQPNVEAELADATANIIVNIQVTAMRSDRSVTLRLELGVEPNLQPRGRIVEV